MTFPRMVSKDAPATREPCRCDRYEFPHRHDWVCEVLAMPPDVSEAEYADREQDGKGLE